jgi:GT2 family glycosyltransferase
VRLSAIVVAFGKPALLEECLTRLEAALDVVEGKTELIVVVNDGSDVPAGGGRNAIPVCGSPQLGFAGGVALGLEVARGEWVALVNDDCLVEAAALARLLEAAETGDDVGSVAAQVLLAGKPGTVNSAGLEIDDLGVARERWLGRVPGAAGAEPVEVFGASATLGLFRRSMLDSLGGFDTSFFAYLEDADLAWRARMAGWRCLLAPGALAVHAHSATLGHGSSAKHFLVGRNRVRMLAKNASARQLRRGLIRIAAYDLLYVGYVAVTARTLSPLAGRLRGLAEGRRYRDAGRPGRVELDLPRSPGLRDALHRNRVYRSARLPRRRPSPLGFVPDDARGGR